MEHWSAHTLLKEISDQDKNKVLKYCLKLQNQKLPVIFSRNHLSKIVKVPSYKIKRMINPNGQSFLYHIFRIPKRNGELRIIHAASKNLKKINNILILRWS